MKKYHYQETMIINVDVYAHSIQEAREKAISAISSALSSMEPLDQIDQDIRDNSFDTIDATINEE